MILVKRIFTCDQYTIGHLYVGESYICDTLEDPDRGLKSTMSFNEISSKKVKGNTAIPTGIYPLILNRFSPKFGKKSFYQSICKGYLPYLSGVLGYEGVLIHCGNTSKDTEGCILVGYNKIKGMILHSQEAFKKLYPLLKGQDKIMITRTY